MCRYAEYGPYKDHYACFGCRKVFRHGQASEVVCPECTVPMADMGLDFKAPPKDDVKQWKKVELLHKHGFTFHSCGCCGPGYRPRSLAEVDQFITENATVSDAERLLKLFETRRHQTR